MRKKANKLLALLTAVAITVTGVNVPANNASAASVKLSAKKVTLTAGKKKTIYLKKGKKKLAIKSVKSSKKKVATVKKSGKKIVITAKKKGTATITVKAKVNKKVKSFKCKVTVKSKTTPTAAPTAAPSAAASSAPASQAPASAVPSDAASAVPSDAASAAPSDDASAAPSADVSAEPSADASAEPSKDPSVATEIVFKNGADNVALTDDDGNFAYVYYDVLDQYGESMKESVSVQWTTSPAGGKADKATGRIKIPKANDKFIFGQMIHVTGVLATQGVTKSQNFTVGLAQAVDTIKPIGFVNKNNISEPVQVLPKNFAKDTWYFLFETFDQNGNPLVVTEDGYGAQNVTVTSKTPLIASADNEDKTTITYDGKDYAAVGIDPEQYVERGGEITLMVISTKTGTTQDYVYRVGETPQLMEFNLEDPGIVRDGDTGVEIPFKAKDTEGNEVTAYETMVRSSNAITLNGGRGTLTLKEKDDGTAKLTWDDDTSVYNVSDASASSMYTRSDVADGLDTLCVLSTVVAGIDGGKNSILQMQISDARIPTTISGTGLPSVLANKDEIGLNILGGLNPKGDNIRTKNMKFKDQDGKDLAAAKANAFFKVAGTEGFGGNGDKNFYGIKLTAKSDYIEAGFYDSANNRAWTADDLTKDLIYYYDGSNVSRTLKADTTGLSAKSQGDDDTFSFSIATLATKDVAKKATAGEWDKAGKAVTNTIKAVPMRALKDFQINISSQQDAYEIVAIASGSAARVIKGDDATNAIDTAAYITAPNRENKPEAVAPYYTITAKTSDGKTTNVKIGGGWTTQGTKSDFTVTDNDKGWMACFGALDPSVKGVTEGDLFDFSKYGNPAKNATFEAWINIGNEDVNAASDGAVKVYKEITVCAEPAYAKSISMDATKTLNPTNMKISSIGAGLTLKGTVKDQYGQTFTGDDVVYTISDYKEVKTTDGTEAAGLVHVDGEVTFEGNGTDSPVIKGAEIGDTFKVTAKVIGKAITAECTVTVGADTKAYISDKVNADEAFRTTYLKYKK